MIGIVLAGAFAVAGVFAAADGAGPPRDGWMQQFTLIDPPLPAPQTEFRTADGAATTLAAFRGKVVLVNFWATWCAPCIREMPTLGRLQAALGGDRFTVAAVSIDRGGARVAQSFLKKLDAKNPGVGALPLYLDGKMALAAALGVRGMPTTFLLDRDGRLVGQLTGIAEWDSPEAQALIRYYIDQR